MSTEAIERFLQEAYTDERLAMLLAHAEDGKLSFHSCCCFVGVLTADHALRGYTNCQDVLFSELTTAQPHYIIARTLDGASLAEAEFREIGGDGPAKEQDAARRASIIPLIRVEIARRDALKSSVSNECLVGVVE